MVMRLPGKADLREKHVGELYCMELGDHGNRAKMVHGGHAYASFGRKRLSEESAFEIFPDFHGRSKPYKIYSGSF